MNKKIFYTGLFFLILFSEVSLFAYATPTYIGIDEEDTYYWEVTFDSAAYDTWINDGGDGTMFTTSYFWTWYNYKGLKYTITQISDEQYYGAYDANGVTIDFNQFYTEENIEEDTWISGTQGNSKVFSATDLDVDNIAYVYWLHRPSFSPTNGIWSTLSADLVNFLESNYSDIAFVLDNSNSEGLWLEIDYSGIDNDLGVTMFFNEEGVLKTYYAEYESNEIISLELTESPGSTEENTEEDNKNNDNSALDNIPGYPLSILLGLTLIGITAICYHYKIKKSK